MHKFILTILFSLLLVGCSDFKSEIANKKQISAKAKICAQVDFENSPFEKKDHVNLFKCLEWDRRIPTLFEAIKNYDEKEWNATVDPVHKSFYKDPIAREMFLSELQLMVNDGSVGAFSNFFTRIFDDDLKLLLNELLATKNHNSLKTMAKIFKDDGSRYLSFLNGVTIISEKLSIGEGKDVDLRESFVKFVDTVSKELLSGKSKLDYTNVNSLFRVGESLPLYDFTQMSDGPDDLAYMISYSSNYPEIYEDTKLINEMLVMGIQCQTPAKDYLFNIDYELTRKIQALYSKSYQEMLNELFDGFSKRIIFKELCYKEFDKPNKTRWQAFERSMDHLLGFKKPAQFQFIKNIHMLFDAKSSTSSTLRFLSSDVSRALNDYLGKLSIRESVNLYNFVKTMTPEQHQEVAKSMEVVFNHKHRDEVVELFKIWENLSPKSKLKITEIFLEKVKVNNFHLFEKHLLKILSNRPELFSELLKGINGGKLIGRNLEFANTFLNAGDDYGKFISKSFLQSYITSLVTNAKFVYKNKKYEEGYLGKYVFSAKGSNQEIINLQTCFKELLPDAKELSLSLFTQNLDKSCTELRDPSEVIPFITIWLHNINEEFFEINGDYLIEENSWYDRELTSSLMALLFISNTKHKEIYNAPASQLVERISKHFDKFTERQIDSIFSLIEKSGGTQKQFTVDILKHFTSPNRKELNTKLAKFVDEYVKGKAYVWENKKVDCKQLNDLIGIEPCFSNETFAGSLSKLFSYVFRDFDNGKLGHSLVSLFTPGEGISIPFSRKKSVKKVVTIKELLGMFTDFYYKRSTMKYYVTKKSSYEVQVNTLEKIETTVREISFLENFYGSFFVNKVSAGKDYLKTVKGLKKQLGLMKGVRGALDVINLIPPHAKVMLQNVVESYDGLIEAGEPFKESVTGSEMNYSSVLQGLLSAITQTSHPKYTKFFPYKKPDLKAGQNHNSQFLVDVVDLGLGSLLQNFLIEKMDNNPKKFFASKDFLVINENLINSLSGEALHGLMDELEVTLMSNGQLKTEYKKMLLDFLNNKNIKLEYAQPLMWKLMVLSSELKFTKGEADKILKIVPHFLRNLSQYSSLSENKNLNLILEKFSGLLDFLVVKIREDIKFKSQFKNDIKFMISKSDKLTLVLDELLKPENVSKLHDVLNLMGKILVELEQKDKVFLSELLNQVMKDGVLDEVFNKLHVEMLGGGNTFTSFIKYLELKSSMGGSVLADVINTLLKDKKHHTKELLKMIDLTVQEVL